MNEILIRLATGCATDAEQLRAANALIRLQAGLELIEKSGALHGGKWCVAQAHGHLSEMGFDPPGA